MSLSSYDAQLLMQAGFIEKEIMDLADAVTPAGTPQPPINLDSPAWQAMIQSRMEWVADKVNQGWSEWQIREEIMAYYARSGSRSPFDFLKLSYRPSKRVDYFAALANQKARQIQSVMGRYNP